MPKLDITTNNPNLILPALKAPSILKSIEKYRNLLSTKNTQQILVRKMLEKYPEIGYLESLTTKEFLEAKKSETDNSLSLSILYLAIAKIEKIELKKQAETTPKSKTDFHKMVAEKEAEFNKTSQKLDGTIIALDSELREIVLEVDTNIDYDEVEVALDEIAKKLLEVNIDISTLSTADLKTLLASIESLNSFRS